MRKTFYRRYLIPSVLLTTSSLASGLSDSIVTGANCPLKVADFSKKKILKTTKTAKMGDPVRFKSMAGAKFFKLTFSKKTKLILIQYPAKTKNYYFVDSACLFATKKSAKTAVARSAPPAPVTRPTDRTSGRSEFFSQAIFSEVAFSVQTYKMTGTLKFPNKPSAQMQAQVMGLLFESGYRLRKHHWEMALTGGGFIGTGELGKSLAEDQQGSLKNINYQASSVAVFGAQISPSILFRPSSKSVSVGLKMPVSWIKTNWPIPAGPGYDVLPRASFAGALLLETRLERDRFTVIQNVGFYKKWGAISWAMGIGYQL